jgi:hypothetical protein
MIQQVPVAKKHRDKISTQQKRSLAVGTYCSVHDFIFLMRKQAGRHLFSSGVLRF